MVLAASSVSRYRYSRKIHFVQIAVNHLHGPVQLHVDPMRFEQTNTPRVGTVRSDHRRGINAPLSDYGFEHTGKIESQLNSFCFFDFPNKRTELFEHVRISCSK